MKKLLRMALLIGGIAAVAKIVAARKGQWEGLTESQVRERLDTRLPGRMPTEKKAEVADKVVAKMQERGLLADEEEHEPTSEEPVEAADAVTTDEPADDGADEAVDQAPEEPSGDTEVKVDDRDEESVEST